ncbi:MAG: hypothetical protein RMK84_14080 [Oscillochloridaceae bacterium]|nr:hypothetical protein [Chloroflexaceae bacterium]MDW8391249.1 hypothetical protein [Oscillochloridaceae bacterium]
MTRKVDTLFHPLYGGEFLKLIGARLNCDVLMLQLVFAQIHVIIPRDAMAARINPDRFEEGVEQLKAIKIEKSPAIVYLLHTVDKSCQ